MGQQMGRLPDTWGELVEEKDRVMHWSSEILARVDDSIKSEDAFLTDYDNAKIDAKVDRWIENRRQKWEVTLAKYKREVPRNTLNIEIVEIADDLRHKMRKDYQAAYAKMKKLTKSIDAMGNDERKIHKKLQDIESACNNDPKVFVAKLGSLRRRVFLNLRQSEKMLFEEKKLRASFTRKVYNIDRKYIEECGARINKLVTNIQQSVENLQ